MTWRHRARCSGNVDPFFAEDDPSGYAVARAICATCPVVDPCREEAIPDPKLVGIWGGLSARERQRERLRRLEQAVAS